MLNAVSCFENSRFSDETRSRSYARFYFCQSLVDQLRIAPGVREAAKQLLAEVQEGITRCDRGEADACIELLERYPDLPASVRDSLASAIARAKSK